MNEKIIKFIEILGDPTNIPEDRMLLLIENALNDMLDQTKGNLKSIKINTSIHQTDYDALIIRIIGYVR